MPRSGKGWVGFVGVFLFIYWVSSSTVLNRRCAEIIFTIKLNSRKKQLIWAATSLVAVWKACCGLFSWYYGKLCWQLASVLRQLSFWSTSTCRPSHACCRKHSSCLILWTDCGWKHSDICERLKVTPESRTSLRVSYWVLKPLKIRATRRLAIWSVQQRVTGRCTVWSAVLFPSQQRPISSNLQLVVGLEINWSSLV